MKPVLNTLDIVVADIAASIEVSRDIMDGPRQIRALDLGCGHGLRGEALSRRRGPPAVFARVTNGRAVLSEISEPDAGVRVGPGSQGGDWCPANGPWLPGDGYDDERGRAGAWLGTALSVVVAGFKEVRE